jgi:hypothetical protein
MPVATAFTRLSMPAVIPVRVAPHPRATLAAEVAAVDFKQGV